MTDKAELSQIIRLQGQCNMFLAPATIPLGPLDLWRPLAFNIYQNRAQVWHWRNFCGRHFRISNIYTLLDFFILWILRSWKKLVRFWEKNKLNLTNATKPTKTTQAKKSNNNNFNSIVNYGIFYTNSSNLGPIICCDLIVRWQHLGGWKHWSQHCSFGGRLLQLFTWSVAAYFCSLHLVFTVRSKI